ncbi:MAG: thermonuclease family protein [Verrucomicrobiae bacterium]|nr:thermonuclease family protein [Verrucomicrobiae bacterium]MCP5521176.1 thermonuclease family protein [Verrucomicrobiales bacterium]
MGLFHKLHYAAVTLTWLAAAGVAFLGWQYRQSFTPAVDWARAIAITKGFKQEISGELRGTADRILDETSFRLKTTNGALATVRLTGIQARSLSSATTREQADQAVAARRLLGELVLSNEVRVEISHVQQPGAVLGLAWVGETNVNLALVRKGVARANTEFMRGLPLDFRYALLRTDRLSAGVSP